MPSEEAEIFGRRLKNLRLQHHETQPVLMDLLHYNHHQNIGYLESGRNEPSLWVLITLAKHYHVTTDYLLGLTDQPNATTITIGEKVVYPSPSGIVIGGTFFEARGDGRYEG